MKVGYPPCSDFGEKAGGLGMMSTIVMSSPDAEEVLFGPVIHNLARSVVVVEPVHRDVLRTSAKTN